MKHLMIGIIISVWLITAGLTPGASQIYSKAVKFAKAGKGDFAYMHFNKLLRDFPSSKYREQALFATAEYYFQTSEWEKAENAFQSYIDEYPESDDKLYALACLLNIADKMNKRLSSEELSRKIIDLQSVSFVFRESKEIAYRSPLEQEYKAVISIDKIEFFLEGELFAQVAF